jgi:hypothetical protein
LGFGASRGQSSVCGDKIIVWGRDDWGTFL